MRQSENMRFYTASQSVLADSVPLTETKVISSRTRILALLSAQLLNHTAVVRFRLPVLLKSSSDPDKWTIDNISMSPSTLLGTWGTMSDPGRRRTQDFKPHFRPGSGYTIYFRKCRPDPLKAYHSSCCVNVSHFTAHIEFPITNRLQGVTLPTYPNRQIDKTSLRGCVCNMVDVCGRRNWIALHVASRSQHQSIK